jgi:hypothetical protein
MIPNTYNMELSTFIHEKLFPGYTKSSTNIQNGEHFEYFIGREIEFSTSIVNIYDGAMEIEPKNVPNIWLNYEKNKFKNQLLEYEVGDDVIIKAKITRCGYNMNVKYLYMELITISKLGTSIASREFEKMQKEQEIIKNDAHIAGIWGAIKFVIPYAIGGYVCALFVGLFSQIGAIIIFIIAVLFGIWIGYAEAYSERADELEKHFKYPNDKIWRGPR